MNPFFAFVATLVESVLTLLLIRFVYRVMRKLFGNKPPASQAEGVAQPGD